MKATLKHYLAFVACWFATASIALAQPTITAQPTNQSVSLGANVTFEVTFTGGFEPYTYQWRRNETALAGETNATLTLTNAQLAHASSYTVVITDSFNDSTTSEAALLTVDPTFTKITTGPVVTDLEGSSTAAWGDYDNDGFIDLVIGGYETTSLYRNNGDETFTKIVSGEIVTDRAEGIGAHLIDYDNDGFLDVYVQNFSDFRNALYHNNGNGSFTKVLTGALVQDDPRPQGGSWGDYDNDGHLDLLVANWMASTALYRNNGDGTFDKMSDSQAGLITSHNGPSNRASWADYDGDGDLDALVSGGGGTKNLFYRNNGNGTFTQLFQPDIGDLDDVGGYWIGPSWFDYDNDGDLDLFIANGAVSQLLDDAFYRNDGGTFTKLTTNQVGSIVADGKTGFQSAVADYDNDGYLDVFVAVPSRTQAGETGDNNLLYHNNGDGTFSRVTTGSLVQDGGASGAGVWGDYNNDGFMDLVVANGWLSNAGPQNNFLYRNNGNTNHWLKVKLIGTASNRGGVGAKVRVKASIGGRTFWQLRVAHDRHDPRPNFGLGNATVAETVRIEWLSGIVQELHNVPANQTISVTEPVRLQAMGRGVFEFRSWKGQVFQVEASPDLSAWSFLGSVTNTNSFIRFADPERLNASQRFYRVRPR